MRYLKNKIKNVCYSEREYLYLLTERDPIKNIKCPSPKYHKKFKNKK